MPLSFMKENLGADSEVGHNGRYVVTLLYNFFLSSPLGVSNNFSSVYVLACIVCACIGPDLSGLLYNLYIYAWISKYLAQLLSLRSRSVI